LSNRFLNIQKVPILQSPASKFMQRFVSGSMMLMAKRNTAIVESFLAKRTRTRMRGFDTDEGTTRLRRLGTNPGPVLRISLWLR
jgi:hypothetical protein